MITFKENKERLQEINPYYRWKEFDMELVYSKAAKLFAYKDIRLLIPFERMKFGDSVFIPLQPRYWNKIKWLQGDPTIRILYIDPPGSKTPWGVRVWRWTVPQAQIRRPRRRLKLVA